MQCLPLFVGWIVSHLKLSSPSYMQDILSLMISILFYSVFKYSSLGRVIISNSARDLVISQLPYVQFVACLRVCVERGLAN